MANRGNDDDGLSFAERYEAVLVPTIFQPWARELIGRAMPEDGQDILDLACGTGVVTREIIRAGVSPAALTAVDHSDEMLSAAKARAVSEGIEAEWILADAGRLPFADGRFDLAVSQQGFQFFPDRAQALSELHRVMAHGGRILFSVQGELSLNPLLQAQAATLDRHVGPEAGAAVRAICGLPDGEEIATLFRSAGFREVTVESVSLDLHHPDGRAFAEGALGGMHTGDKLSGTGPEQRSEIIEDFLAGLGSVYDGVALRFPHVSNVITARV